MGHADCYGCRFRREIFTDAYSTCNNKAATVKEKPSDELNGWHFWPFIYDPDCVISCDGFVGKSNK